MIFSISHGLDKAQKISESTFIGLNIWERTHIEEWVRSNPEILGEDLLILSIEFDRFINSSDRLDILALDRNGNLVVVELKRDSAAGFADLQAIRYAAMVSSMTIEKLLPYYIAYRKKYYSEQLSEGEAQDQIVEFVESDSFNELSRKPRIILCSEGFSQEITTTVLWLRDFQIDIGCVKITPYKIDEKIIIVPKVLIPLQEAKQYLIDIKIKEEEQEQSNRKNRPKTSFGNAGGIELHTTVMPFILRGVRLIGVDSAATAMPLRCEIWRRLASDLRPQSLAQVAHSVPFTELPQVFPQLLQGKLRGRTVVGIKPIG